MHARFYYTIGFQALHLTHTQQMLQSATTTVRQALTIHGHRPTSLPAAIRTASPPYYGDNTDHLVNNAYTFPRWPFILVFMTRFRNGDRDEVAGKPANT